MQRHSRLTTIGLVSGGLVAGVVLASTMAAQAASPSPSPTAGSTAATTTEDPHPGDNGADGVPESQEHHGDHHGQGHGLDLSGTVTKVGTDSVTIKTVTGTVDYAVTSGSDIDKNGEAKLSDLAVGDAVTFSADGTTSKTIDKLHAGDEAKNAPADKAPAGSDATASPSA